jgi:hypothetical protein
MAGAADRVALRGLVRRRIRVVLPVRVAWVGRLDEGERCRPAVDRHRPDLQVRAQGLIGHRPALEVQAEAGQALRGPVGEDDVVSRQEPVRGRVVDQVHAGMHAGVAAVAGVRVQVGAEMRQRVSTGLAVHRLPPGPAGTGAGAGAGERCRAQPEDRQRDRDTDRNRGAWAVTGRHESSSSRILVGMVRMEVQIRRNYHDSRRNGRGSVVLKSHCCRCLSTNVTSTA